VIAGGAEPLQRVSRLGGSILARRPGMRGSGSRAVQHTPAAFGRARRRCGASRKIGYKFLARYEASGPPASPISRAARSGPHCARTGAASAPASSGPDSRGRSGSPRSSLCRAAGMTTVSAPPMQVGRSLREESVPGAGLRNPEKCRRPFCARAEFPPDLTSSCAHGMDSCPTGARHWT